MWWLFQLDGYFLQNHFVEICDNKSGINILQTDFGRNFTHSNFLNLLSLQMKEWIIWMYNNSTWVASFLYRLQKFQKNIIYQDYFCEFWCLRVFQVKSTQNWHITLDEKNLHKRFIVDIFGIVSELKLLIVKFWPYIQAISLGRKAEDYHMISYFIFYIFISSPFKAEKIFLVSVSFLW